MKKQDWGWIIFCIIFFLFLFLGLVQIWPGYVTWDRDTMFTISRVILTFIVLISARTVIGFNFSWEKCKCCGKKYGVHGYLKVEDLSLPPEALKPLREGKTKSNIKSAPKANTRPETPPPSQSHRKCQECGTIYRPKDPLSPPQYPWKCQKCETIYFPE